MSPTSANSGVYLRLGVFCFGPIQTAGYLEGLEPQQSKKFSFFLELLSFRFLLVPKIPHNCLITEM